MEEETRDKLLKVLRDADFLPKDVALIASDARNNGSVIKVWIDIDKYNTLNDFLEALYYTGISVQKQIEKFFTKHSIDIALFNVFDPYEETSYLITGLDTDEDIIYELGIYRLKENG